MLPWSTRKLVKSNFIIIIIKEIIIIIIIIILFVYFSALMCFPPELACYLTLTLCCDCPYCNYFCLHCAVSVIGLVPVDAAHK
jgi:hypothetical protein